MNPFDAAARKINRDLGVMVAVATVADSLWYHHWVK